MTSTTDELIKSMVEEYANNKKQNIYVAIKLGSFGFPKISGPNGYVVTIYTSEKMLQVIAELRTIEKPILWDISLSKVYELKEQTWFECLNKIENGDMISIMYHSILHDDFMILIDIIKQFGLGKIFIQFDRKFDPDIIKIVSDATYAQVYYDRSGLALFPSEYTRFED